MCHLKNMSIAESLHPALYSRLVDSLYIDAMVMADEARSYFDRKAAEERERLDMMTRLNFSCESLKVTTRLMHVIAWLLAQRAWQRGEITRDALSDPKYHLGAAASTEPAVLMAMPTCARELVRSSEALYDRVLRLQERMLAAQSPAMMKQMEDAPASSPARDLLDKLEQAF
tara:strand:+ start:51191 stop:51706 length:516 start_codon:yes stop_codon:yes gene_type:complete